MLILQRFIPHPVLSLLHGVAGAVFEYAREITSLHVAIHEQGRRDERGWVILQIRRHDQVSVSTMPMKEEIVPRITCPLMHHDKTSRRRRPALLFTTEIVSGILGSRPLGRGMDKAVELIAAANRPITRRPKSRKKPKASKVQPLILGTMESLGRWNVLGQVPIGGCLNPGGPCGRRILATERGGEVQSTRQTGVEGREGFPVIIKIQMQPDADLVQIIAALGHLRRLFGPAQRW